MIMKGEGWPKKNLHSNSIRARTSRVHYQERLISRNTNREKKEEGRRKKEGERGIKME
jgi:hypothetical protein